MSRVHTPATALAAAFAVLACASPSPQQPAGPLVRPVQLVRHGIDAQTAYSTGRYYQGQVRFDDAIDAYKRVLAIQPDHADALNALGVIYSLQNRPELAEASFRAAMAAAPRSAQVHNNLGYHLMQAGRVAEALAAFEQAHAIEPDNATAAANLATAHSKLALVSEPPGAAAVAVAAAVPAPAQVQVPLQVPVPVQVQSQAQPQAAPPAGEPPASPPLAAIAMGAAPAQPPVAAALPAAAAPPAAVPPSRQPGLLEISNGNGVTGLARRMSLSLSPRGYERMRLTNQRPFAVPTSRIFYVQGAEQMAQDINATLPARLPLARVTGLERSARVRVLLGKDFPSQAVGSDFSPRSTS